MVKGRMIAMELPLSLAIKDIIYGNLAKRECGISIETLRLKAEISCHWFGDLLVPSTRTPQTTSYV